MPGLKQFCIEQRRVAGLPETRKRAKLDLFFHSFLKSKAKEAEKITNSAPFNVDPSIVTRDGNKECEMSTIKRTPQTTRIPTK